MRVRGFIFILMLISCLLWLCGCACFGPNCGRQLADLSPVPEVSIILSPYLTNYEYETLATFKVEVTNASYSRLNPTEEIIWKLIHQAREVGADAITNIKIRACHDRLSGSTWRLAYGEAVAVKVSSEDVHRLVDANTATSYVRIQSTENPPRQNIPIFFSVFLKHYNHETITTVQTKMEQSSTDEIGKTEEALTELIRQAKLTGANAISEVEFELHEGYQMIRATAIEFFPSSR